MATRYIPLKHGTGFLIFWSYEMTMIKPMTIKKFNEQFPDDDAWLDHLMKVRYGAKFFCSNCGAEAKYYRVAKRRCYECEFCGYQVIRLPEHPLLAHVRPCTIGSLSCSCSCSARPVTASAQRKSSARLALTDKTAWRMGHEIRKFMGRVDGDNQIGGSVRSCYVEQKLVHGSANLRCIDNP